MACPTGGTVLDAQTGRMTLTALPAEGCRHGTYVRGMSFLVYSEAIALCTGPTCWGHPASSNFVHLAINQESTECLLNLPVAPSTAPKESNVEEPPDAAGA